MGEEPIGFAHVFPRELPLKFSILFFLVPIVQFTALN